MNRLIVLLCSMLFVLTNAHAFECPAPEGFVEVEPNLTWYRPTSKAITLVNLWAVWCPPCLKELPMLDDIATQPNFNIETIHIGNNLDAINQQFTKLDIKHLSKTIEPSFNFVHDWGFQGLPATMIVIDGQVKFGYTGYIRNDMNEVNEWLTCLAKSNHQD